MASRGKKKTTMAKLNRESKLRERRAEKAHRKDVRRQAAANPQDPVDDVPSEDEFPGIADTVAGERA